MLAGMPEVHAGVVAAIATAWDEGCPVAGQDLDQQTEQANVAVRRWRSASRRHPRKLTPQVQVEDLAKGLLDAFEADPKLVGPLIEDYRFLAARIAAAMTG